MIARLKGLLDEIGPDWIVVDVGGVGYQVFCPARVIAAPLPLVAAAGADVLVAGSAVFKGGSVDQPQVYGENIRAIRAAAQAAL